MNRVFSINQGYKVKKRACAARQGNSAPLRVLTNEPVTCRRALWATRQALGDDDHRSLQLAFETDDRRSVLQRGFPYRRRLKYSVQGGFDPSKKSGVGVDFEHLVNSLPGPNKDRARKPSLI